MSAKKSKKAYLKDIPDAFCNSELAFQSLLSLTPLPSLLDCPFPSNPSNKPTINKSLQPEKNA